MDSRTCRFIGWSSPSSSSRFAPASSSRWRRRISTRLSSRACATGTSGRVGAGRATTVTGIRSEPATFYMGSTGGGVWKTTDFGQSWRNVSDGFFATGSIGAIRAAPSDEKVIYAGTGSDGLRSNVITGRGIYRSDDAGKTWRFLGLREVGQIGAVEIHPTDPDPRLRGRHRTGIRPQPRTRSLSELGTVARTGKLVLFVSDRVGAVDLELNPANPDEIYACTWRGERKPWTIISGDDEGSGVHKSTDGGDPLEEARQGASHGPFRQERPRRLGRGAGSASISSSRRPIRRAASTGRTIAARVSNACLRTPGPERRARSTTPTSMPTPRTPMSCTSTPPGSSSPTTAAKSSSASRRPTATITTSGSTRTIRSSSSRRTTAEST